MVVILLVILISLCVLDVVINKLNPTPRMKDKEEKKSFPEQYAKPERCMKCV